MPKKAVFQQNGACKRLNPTRSQLNPSYSQLNPSYSQLNPSCSQLNRSCSQLNRSYSQLNPTRSRLNGTRSQLNPSRDQLYLSYSQLNQIDTQRHQIFSDPHCSGGLETFIGSWWSPQPGDPTYCYTDHKLSRFELKYKASILISNTVIKFNIFCCLQDHIPLLGGARGGFWKEIQILSPPQSHLKGTLRKTEYNWGEIRYKTNVLSGHVKQRYCINDYPVGNTYGRFNYFNTIENE